MHDLIIRGGQVVDGTGSAPFPADVAIDDGLITTMAPTLEAEARAEIDATGCLVTPGFVDVHTHYDGQMTWDEGTGAVDPPRGSPRSSPVTAVSVSPPSARAARTG